MDVTTNYNGANNAAVQQNSPMQSSISGSTVAERLGTARHAERPTKTHVSQNNAVNNLKTQDTKDVYKSLLREENITDTMLDRAFEDANKALAGSSFSLSYKVHEGSSRIMVIVRERQTNEILREIPSEDRLDIYARITEFVGLLFDQGN